MRELRNRCAAARDPQGRRPFQTREAEVLGDSGCDAGSGWGSGGKITPCVRLYNQTMAENGGEDPVTELERRLGADWANLREARRLSQKQRAVITEAARDLDSEDTSIVVSGSLARDEFTAGSDLDWTLLIDGSADPQHHALFQKVDHVIKPLAGKDPGREGTFGAMVFSHGLIHEIGGEDDTNKNTTRRLLLLLESRVVGRDDAYRRVVRSILDRYILEDRGLWRGSGHRVPRFLQNDFARYWRTMTVDFAYKLRSRAGKGWAIRNIKLRMSRKLIYVSGLLACYCCHLDFTAEQRTSIYGEPGEQKKVIDHLSELFEMAPLQIVARVLLKYPHLNGAAAKIFRAYDEFIGILADQQKRDRLENLADNDAAEDPVHQRAREISHEYRDGLLEFFFDEQSEIGTLTRNYGVF